MPRGWGMKLGLMGKVQLHVLNFPLLGSGRWTEIVDSRQLSERYPKLSKQKIQSREKREEVTGYHSKRPLRFSIASIGLQSFQVPDPRHKYALRPI